MQDERLVVDLDKLGEIGLLFFDVDVGVEVIAEDAEEPVNPDIDAGWLEQRGVVRINDDPAFANESFNGAIRKNHAAILARL